MTSVWRYCLTCVGGSPTSPWQRSVKVVYFFMSLLQRSVSAQWLLCFFFSVKYVQFPVFLSVTEIVGVEYRRTVGILYQMFFSIGNLILPLLAYFITDWRWLQVVITAPYMLFLSYYWWETLYSYILFCICSGRSSHLSFMSVFKYFAITKIKSWSTCFSILVQTWSQCFYSNILQWTSPLPFVFTSWDHHLWFAVSNHKGDSVLCYTTPKKR